MLKGEQCLKGKGVLQCLKGKGVLNGLVKGKGVLNGLATLMTGTARFLATAPFALPLRL